MGRGDVPEQSSASRAYPAWATSNGRAYLYLEGAGDGKGVLLHLGQRLLRGGGRCGGRSVGGGVLEL